MSCFNPNHVCRDPEPFPNGQITGERTYGQAIIYSCDVGYNLKIKRTCQSDKNWGDFQIKCDRIKCARRKVANARPSPNFERHDFGSTVRYTCVSGYRLVGQRDVRCVGENTWSADPPVCERIQCQKRAVANARTLPEGQAVWYSGDSVTYECFVGYLMVGSALSTCRDDTTWSTPKPVCLRTPCNKTDLPNSIIFPNKDVFQPGEYVAYSCLPGYTLTGRNFTRCLPNGQWTGSRPECQKVRCPNLVVNNGGVSPVTHVWEFGDAATITCDDGHRLAGSGQVINCLANGEWDGAPTCEAVTCSDRNVANAVKSLNQVIWHVNDAVSFVCEEGYRLKGQAASTCLENGQWSASLPQCVERDGWRDWSTWSRCDTSCVKTFEIRQRVCLQAGRCPGRNIEQRPCRSSSSNFGGKTYTVVEMRRNFNGARRFCRSQGGDLATMKNADVRNHLSDVIRGYSNVYRSQFFFGLQRTRHTNWQWVDNTAAGDRHNGRYHSWKGVQPDNALGYEFCGSFFTWNGGWNDIPCNVCLFFICEKDVECPRPNTPDGLSVNAPLSVASFRVGSRLEFRCISANERLVGERSVTCLADGSWNHPTPECVPGCTIFLLPLGVSLPQGEHPVGRQLTVACSGNQVLRGGPSSIVCRGRNEWSTPINSYSCSPQ